MEKAGSKGVAGWRIIAWKPMGYYRLWLAAYCAYFKRRITDLNDNDIAVTCYWPALTGSWEHADFGRFKIRTV
jgi:hypothetical protein